MARVKNKSTAPEVKVRSILHKLGFRFRINRRDLPGTPDIVLPKYRAVVFVHGCFWHGHDCKRGHRPETNKSFWNEKIDKNKKRDELTINKLTELGWRVLVIWQCEIKKKTQAGLELRLKDFLLGENLDDKRG